MEDLFQEVSTNIKDVEYSTYPYYKNKDLLSDISMNDKAKLQQTSKDINGLIKYVESLVNRNNKDITGDNHLGNLKSPIFGTGSQYNTDPQYNSITIETMTNDNENSPESHYITLADKDPISEEKNIEAFERRSQPEKMMPADPISQFYLASLGAIGLFILYRLMVKSS